VEQGRTANPNTVSTKQEQSIPNSISTPTPDPDAPLEPVSASPNPGLVPSDSGSFRTNLTLVAGEPGLVQPDPALVQREPASVRGNFAPADPHFRSILTALTTVNTYLQRLVNYFSFQLFPFTLNLQQNKGKILERLAV
jgi:hypothetical protein